MLFCLAARRSRGRIRPSLGQRTRIEGSVGEKTKKEARLRMAEMKLFGVQTFHEAVKNKAERRPVRSDRRVNLGIAKALAKDGQKPACGRPGGEWIRAGVPT